MHDINLGAAIARERRAAQVTQGELAAHLGVTKAGGCAWLGRRFRPAGKRRLERMAHGCGRIRSRGVCRFLVRRRAGRGR